MVGKIKKKWIVLAVLAVMPMVAIGFLVMSTLITPHGLEVQDRPACVKTEFLHVRIAGQEYMLPRDVIISVKGGDVRHIKDPKGGNDDACQKLGEVWQVDHLHLVLYPIDCEVKKQCSEQEFYLSVSELAKNKNTAETWTIVPNTQAELLEKCRPPREPWNDWHARMWSMCDYQYAYNDLYVWIKFRGGIYPPENINQTIEQAMNLLKQYEIPKE